MDDLLWTGSIGAAVLLLISTLWYLASRYRRCPSDKVLVVYGKVGVGQSARCIHGGGELVWPVIQDYAYLSLTPMTISIDLRNALSLQNIRIDVPSTFTVGISVDPSIMNNAAERLLHLPPSDIEEMAKEIIFGQLRLTVASLTIEQINQDRESFLDSIRKNVEPELNKIGLYLINVNITDITDGSGYIESIGKKAAAEAINQAKIDVAEQEKHGAIGESKATRQREIEVAENWAEAEKGKKKADADRRVYVQQQETQASIGEANANREENVEVAKAAAEAVKGRKAAEADQRIFVQEREANAIIGENKSKAAIAGANAELAEREAEANRRGEVAKRKAEAEIQRAQYEVEQERLNSAEVVREEIDKRKKEIAAEAEAEKTRREARGQADAILAKYEAEAKGIQQVLAGKADGYRQLVQSCGGDPRAAATLLMTEQLDDLVTLQVEAIKSLKIDKITVWDSGGNGNGGSTTSNFVASMIKSLPPLHEVAAMAGLELPSFLGHVGESGEAGDSAAAVTTTPVRQTTPARPPQSQQPFRPVTKPTADK
jgi:flotillin